MFEICFVTVDWISMSNYGVLNYIYNNLTHIIDLNRKIYLNFVNKKKYIYFTNYTTPGV